QAREALVDHLERGHAPAHDPHLVLEVVAARLPGDRIGLGIDRTGIDTVDERVDLVLIEDFFGGHVATLGLLHDETGEVHGLDSLAVAAPGGHDTPDGAERFAAQALLAVAR